MEGRNTYLGTQRSGGISKVVDGEVVVVQRQLRLHTEDVGCTKQLERARSAGICCGGG